MVYRQLGRLLAGQAGQRRGAARGAAGGRGAVGDGMAGGGEAGWMEGQCAAAAGGAADGAAEDAAEDEEGASELLGQLLALLPATVDTCGTRTDWDQLRPAAMAVLRRCSEAGQPARLRAASVDVLHKLAQGPAGAEVAARLFPELGAKPLI